MSDNEDKKLKNICNSCSHRVVRILHVNEEDIINHEELNPEDLVETSDGGLVIIHEVCIILQLDLHYDVLKCSAFDPKGSKVFISPDILKQM